GRARQELPDRSPRRRSTRYWSEQECHGLTSSRWTSSYPSRKRSQASTSIVSSHHWLALKRMLRYDSRFSTTSPGTVTPSWGSTSERIPRTCTSGRWAEAQFPALPEERNCRNSSASCSLSCRNSSTLQHRPAARQSSRGPKAAPPKLD